MMEFHHFTMAQDIPLFSQKLTNSFVYNPAMAGHTFGSLTFAHRKNFSGVNGLAENNFFSLHTPLMNHKVGVGANLFTEKVNFVNNVYASAAFAYHINFGSYNNFSMGVSAEYNSLGFDITQVDGDDEPFLSERESGMDFSFGVNYQHRFFKAGAAMNRLATNLDLNKNASILSEFYSVYLAGLIPLRGAEDILEPSFTFRKLSRTNDIWDLGLYYTYNNLLLVGGSIRKGDIISMTTGIKIAKMIFVGYSYEVVNNNLRSDIGNSSEITLRFDFNDKTYQQRFRSDYKNSLAFRRKTLSSVAKRSSGSRSPKSFQKKQKRRIKSVKSPSARYNTVKKGQGVKRSKFNNNKRRKKNHRRTNKKRRFR